MAGPITVGTEALQIEYVPDNLMRVGTIAVQAEYVPDTRMRVGTIAVQAEYIPDTHMRVGTVVLQVEFSDVGGGSAPALDVLAQYQLQGEGPMQLQGESLQGD